MIANIISTKPIIIAKRLTVVSFNGIHNVVTILVILLKPSSFNNKDSFYVRVIIINKAI